MIAETIVAAAMLSQAVAEASSPRHEDEQLVIVGPTLTEATQVTARFVCKSKTVEVSYLEANLGGGKPKAGSYIERIFVNDKPIAFHDLQRINAAINGREIVRVSQPYCEAGGAAWIPSMSVKPPRLGEEEHALAIFMHVISQTNEIERQSIEIRFKSLSIQRIVGDTAN